MYENNNNMFKNKTTAVVLNSYIKSCILLSSYLLFFFHIFCCSIPYAKSTPNIPHAVLKSTQNLPYHKFMQNLSRIYPGLVKNFTPKLPYGYPDTILRLSQA